MGDGLKITKDKRHRSSSSLAGVAVESTRSERKLDIRASIPEVDDQFALAEARCDDLQEKIDLVKGLKKKRKLKKRSMTRVTDQPLENVPLISVRTQPKKKVSMQAARLRRLEVPANPTRAYLDPATVEQHRMIRGYNQTYKQQPQDTIISKHNMMPEAEPPQAQTRARPLRTRAYGDGDLHPRSMGMRGSAMEVACGDDEAAQADHLFAKQDAAYNQPVKKPANTKYPSAGRYRRPANKTKEAPHPWPEDLGDKEVRTFRVNQGAQRRPTRHQHNVNQHTEERPVVELFHKGRPVLSADSRRRAVPRVGSDKTVSHLNLDNRGLRDEERSASAGEDDRQELKKEKEPGRHPRRIKYRSRRYELPTVASQMKQAGARYYCGTANHTNIPFIVSKSTAPSHNIGVNIQQVLNGLKIQQPLSGIPYTIAHHMGLGHVPHLMKTAGHTTRQQHQQPSLDNSEMNAIRLGRRLLRLPSYKYMSYNRLLSLYREGDGMVSRFLRAISRPHYFYTSMYNLATREDFDGATSKGRGASQEAKQSLAEYAGLYREYEQIDRRLKEGNYEPELERRREELTRELAAREDHIRKVVQDYRIGVDPEQSTTLRASASTANESYHRNSTFKLNVGDGH